MAQSRISIAVVDDEPFWREALCRELSIAPDIYISIVAASLADVLASDAVTDVDVFLVDVHLGPPDADGLTLTRLLTSRTGGRAKVIVLTADTSPGTIVQSFQCAWQ